MVKNILRKICLVLVRKLIPYFDIVQREKNLSFMRELHSVGTRCFIGNDAQVVGEEYIDLGNNVHLGHHLRLEALDYYAGDSFSPHVVIGDCVNIQNYCHIGCVESVEIGNGTLIASNVYISDHNHGSIKSAEVSLPPDERRLSHRPVKIGRNVWIGEGACILPGVELGDSVIVGANAVVTHSFPAGSVIAGVPAMLIKSLTSDVSFNNA